MHGGLGIHAANSANLIRCSGETNEEHTILWGDIKPLAWLDRHRGRLVMRPKLLICYWSPTWSLDMGNFVADPISDPFMEILPPERDDKTRPNAKACLCCRKMRSPTRMDDDGCGICDECLAS